MNKKGFTLVELLAVIIILGVIGLIATVTVNNVLKENRESLYNEQIKLIEDKAKLWAAEHVFELPDEDKEHIILTLGQLKAEGLSGEVINPITEEPFLDSLQIKITKVENSYIYEVLTDEVE